MHTFTPAQRAWIADLRSGKFKQSRDVLTEIHEDGSRSHCCLGVGAEGALAAGVVKAAEKQWHRTYYSLDTTPEYAGDTLLLDFSGAREYLGLRTHDGYLPGVLDRDGSSMTLARCNDAGLTFAQIADLIEHFAADLFVPTEAN